MARKKKLKIEEFEKALEINSKDKPFDINSYNRQSVIDIRSKYPVSWSFYVSFNCANKSCNKFTWKNLIHGRNMNINSITYCQACNMKSAFLENYGFDNPLKSEKVKEKIANTNLERYGNRCSLHGTNQEKTEKRFEEIYGEGIKNPFQAQEVIDKILDVKLESGCMSQVPWYKYNNVSFDSSWEVAFYIYHNDKGHNIIHEPKRFNIM